MHPAHNARPQHIRHHLHQAMHPQRPPTVGINVGPQMRHPHHHISNIPPHGGHQQMSPYIPPHQREGNRLGHLQPRINSQIHHPQIQNSKFRSATGRMGLAGPAINQPNSQLHGPQLVVAQQSRGLQQSRGSQQSHGLQSVHTSQQPHGLHQQQACPKPQEVAKLASVQKSHQPVGTHQGISLQVSVNTQQKMQQQKPNLPQQQSVLLHQTIHTKQHSSPLKPVGLKHSQTSLSFKSSQPQILQPNPIRVSQSQPSIHSQPVPSNKSFQSSYKPAHTHKTAIISQQIISIRPNNLQPHRSSPPQKIQMKTTVTSGALVPISNVVSIPTSKLSPNSMQSPSSSNALTSTSAPPPISSSIPAPPPIPTDVHYHQQAISNETSSAHSSIAAAQSQPTHKVPQHGSALIESRKITSDNQLKTQTNQQNLNPPVSTNQQEILSEMDCENSRNLSIHDNLANIKEKTPMCLVNELARFNKIQHQYRLTAEQGPAHCKRFTVSLKLGDEDYSAEGLSIKKAQHAAAAEAITKTSYQHPPVKTIRLKNGKPGIGNITPTVELNALLMKLGEPAMYVPNPDAAPHQILGPAASHSPNGLPIPVHSQNCMQDFSNYNRPNSTNMYPSPRCQRIASGRPYNRGFVKYGSRFAHPLNGTKELCKMTLIVGEHTFVGFGMTPQLAKHDAATKALDVLRPLVSTDDTSDVQNTSIEDPNADLKSPISLVHETALKRNLTVTFEVKSERGPPHMKTFITLCRVGDIVTEGEGNGKKVSKKRAAEKMLDELKKLPPLSPSKMNPKVVTLKTLKRKTPFLKRKPKNLIKEKPEPEIPEEVNPISKLIQIQQALKEREPIYTLVEEKGAPRRREFIIEVSAGGHVARGTGANKKFAKKIAARNLLILMGYEMPSISDENISQITNGGECSDKSRKNFHDDSYPSTSQGGNVGRQIVPGLLLMQQTSKSSFVKSSDSYNQQSHTVSSTATSNEETNSTSKKTTTPSPLPSTFNHDGVRPKEQLLYLAQLLGFQAVFSDYPKGNHGEYLTIVTLSTDPPQICHGAGCDTEQSQDKASMTALQMLSELGLDNVKPKKLQEEKKIDSATIEVSKE